MNCVRCWRSVCVAVMASGSGRRSSRCSTCCWPPCPMSMSTKRSPRVVRSSRSFRGSIRSPSRAASSARCVATRRKGSRGSASCVALHWADVWPTTWGWARRSRCWPCSRRDAKKAPACRCWWCRVHSCSTGCVRPRASRRSSRCMISVMPSGRWMTSIPSMRIWRLRPTAPCVVISRGLARVGSTM